MSEVNGRIGNCTKFLHKGKELAGPDNTEVTTENRETHRAILLPITLIFKPTEIIFMCDGKFNQIMLSSVLLNVSFDVTMY